MNIYPPGARIADQFEVASRPLMGGMGIVYLCLHQPSGHPVALKTFRPEFLPDRAARDRFLQEGTTWINLGSHMHIVRCYQAIHLDLEVYLALELVAKEEGHVDASLRSWLLPGRPLPVEQALLFALQVARGMAHATATIPGLVHRDLKPENVLVGSDRLPGMGANRLRVTDFGLATVLQEMSGKLQIEEQDSDASRRRTLLTHGIVGTPEYMAPEQWEVRDIDVRTDIYALGVYPGGNVDRTDASESKATAGMSPIASKWSSPESGAWPARCYNFCIGWLPGHKPQRTLCQLGGSGRGTGGGLRGDDGADRTWAGASAGAGLGGASDGWLVV